MKPLIFIISPVFVFFFILIFSDLYSQEIPEEALKHLARGEAAEEIAKTNEDFQTAINEYQFASSIAPDWSEPYLKLGMVFEKINNYKEAIQNYKKYIQLAPNADNINDIKKLVYKLEYKIEQEISDDEALNIFGSIGEYEKTKWKFTGKRSGRGTALIFKRNGNNIEITFFSATMGNGYVTKTAKVNGRILEYDSFYGTSATQWTKKVTMEIISRNKIKGTEVETFLNDNSKETFNFEYTFPQ